MHQCIHCQTELADNAQFCASCGKPVEESLTSPVDPTTADTAVEDDAEITSKHSALVLSGTPELPTLRTRRMHPQSSISAFPADSWQALETPEDEASATETAPDEAAAGPTATLAEVALDTPEEQKAFDEPDQTEQASPETATPSAIEDIDTMSLSMTELAEIAATPLDAPAQAPATQESAPEEVANAADEVPALSPVSQTPVPTEPGSPAGSEPLSPIPATPEPQAEDIADLPTSHIPLASPASTPEPEPEEISPAHSNLAPLTPIPQTPLPEDITPAPTSGPLSPVPQTPLQEDSTTAPASGPLSPIPQTPLPEETAPANEAEAAPAPMPVRESTPRPQASSPAAQLPPPTTTGRARRRRNTILLVALIVALVVLLGGTGLYILLRPQASASTTQCDSQQTTCVNGTPVTIVKKPTSLTFSGAVTGPMTIVATPTCQSATSGNLHTLTINLSGTINDKLYNFGFVIEHYNGPGTYSNATTSLLVLFATPGESTTNGWSNSDPTDTGSITIDKGEQTGSITYGLSGAGTNAKTQVQASGTWSCGK